VERGRTTEVEGLERIPKERDGSGLGCMVEEEGRSIELEENINDVDEEGYVGSRASSSCSLRERTTSCSEVSLSPTGEVQEQAPEEKN